MSKIRQKHKEKLTNSAAFWEVLIPLSIIDKTHTNQKEYRKMTSVVNKFGVVDTYRGPSTERALRVHSLVRERQRR